MRTSHGSASSAAAPVGSSREDEPPLAGKQEDEDGDDNDESKGSEGSEGRDMDGDARS